ncbi:PREDICTED: uncharacterized protein LOC109237194 [Nicotiana attenuata]|uniref:uncharacterized protein LOC109237194 n=1 Tax=Nicotiana attenuata TaxID=49451 RepID=UPI000905A614|nr:PREDICTED: uncharacterized protein LOC109237194 [Nicotiana attenuata]
MGDKVRWPKEMKSDPSKRNPDFWCEFHNDHSHRTADCRLRQGEVEHLLKQGYLTDLFRGDEVNGVTYTTAKNMSKVTVVLDGGSITFDDEDVDDLMIPHNDTLVISLLVRDTNVKRVLIDPGSSINIILLRVEVVLTTFAEGVIKDTKFLVIDADMDYNIILGRPWIHDMDIVPSTLHQAIKFPSRWGIRQIRRDQQASRSINSMVVASTVTDVTDEK